MDVRDVARRGAAAAVSIAALGWGAFSVAWTAPGATIYEAVPAPQPTTSLASPTASATPTTGEDDAQPLVSVEHLGPSNQKPGAANEDTLTINKPKTVSHVAVKKVKLPRGKLLAMPVNGPITSSFGMRFHPVLHVYKLHTGTDFGVACGTPVGSSAAGTVVSAGWGGGYGLRVVVDHGTIAGHHLQTSYNHLDALGVRPGQKVDVGTGVGLVGNTGYSTGCHLHFEVIVDGQFTDPVPWLNGKPAVVNLKDIVKPPAPSPSSTPTPSVSTTPSPSAASPTPTPSVSTTPRPSVHLSSTGTPKPHPSVPPSTTPCPTPTPGAAATPGACWHTPTPTPLPSGRPTSGPTPSAGPTATPSQPESTLSPSASPRR